MECFRSLLECTGLWCAAMSSRTSRSRSCRKARAVLPDSLRESYHTLAGVLAARPPWGPVRISRSQQHVCRRGLRPPSTGKTLCPVWATRVSIRTLRDGLSSSAIETDAQIPSKQSTAATGSPHVSRASSTSRNAIEGRSGASVYFSGTTRDGSLSAGLSAARIPEAASRRRLNRRKKAKA